MSSQQTSRPFSQSIGGRNLFKFKQQHNIISANNLNNSIQSAEEELPKKLIPTSPVSTSSNHGLGLVAQAAKLHSTSRFRHVNIVDYNSHSVGTDAEILTPKISARGLNEGK